MNGQEKMHGLAAAMHDMSRHGMAWHGMAWHGMAWHGMASTIRQYTTSVHADGVEARTNLRAVNNLGALNVETNDTTSDGEM